MQQLAKALNQNPASQQVAALAMLLYSCRQVHELAQGAQASPEILHAYVQPSLMLEPPRFIDLINSMSSLDAALLVMINILEGKRLNASGVEKKEPLSAAEQAGLKQVILYAHGALKLRKNLLKDTQKLTILENRLPIITRFQELQPPPATHESPNDTLQPVVSKLAALYLDLFSQMDFRIIVQGTPGALRDTVKVEQIRCLLLGAIRFAVLWHQVGGRKWQFIFGRGKILREGQQLRNLIAQSTSTTAQIFKIKP